MTRLTVDTLKFMGAMKTAFSDLSVNDLSDLLNKFIKSNLVQLGDGIDPSAFTEFITEKYPFQEQSDLFEIDDPLNDQLNQQYLSQLDKIFNNFDIAFKAMVNDIDRENLILYKNVMNRWKQASNGGG